MFLDDRLLAIGRKIKDNNTIVYSNRLVLEMYDEVLNEFKKLGHPAPNSAVIATMKRVCNTWDMVAYKLKQEGINLIIPGSLKKFFLEDNEGMAIIVKATWEKEFNTKI